MQRIGKYILKTVGWTLLVVFLLFSGAGILFYFKAESYVQKHLSRIVKEKSDGLYELAFENIELKIRPFSARVHNISLKTNKEISNQLQKENPNKTFYSFRSPELYFEQVNLFELYKNKSLCCERIAIQQPEFEILGRTIQQSGSENNLDKLFQEIRPLFMQRIKNVLINEIDLIDANYKLYHSLSNSSEISNAQKVSLSIKRFRTDSALIFSPSGFFKSDDILIRMEKFEKNLSDSIHALRIDTLEYSLQSTDISAQGFYLQHTAKNRTKNLYDVYVPGLRLKSKNLSSFSLNDTLDIEFLEFENPEINFYQKEATNKLKLKQINQFNLYSLVEDQFSEIKIDSFVLSNANLKIFQQPNDSSFQQHFEEITVHLNSFALDSMSSKQTDKLFHADNISMSIRGYHLKLEDKEHDFSADSMHISTISNSLGVRGIRILPTIGKGNKNRTLVNINCNALEISGVDIKKVYHTRTIPTRNISITEPSILLQYQSEIERKKGEAKTGLLFDLISAYLKGVYSEVVEVKHGSLNIQTIDKQKVQGYFETAFSFNLSGFALDSASIKQTNKFFYASNFDIQFSDYQMKLTDNLHKINVERVSIESFNNKLEIENLRLKPIIKNVDIKTIQQFNRSELYNIEVPKITLWGINLRDAFFYNKLNISKFRVANPKIYFENFGSLKKNKEKKESTEFYRLIFNYLHDFNIREISIPNGKFTWINHTRKGKTTSFDNAFSATLKNFRLNENELKKERLLFSDDFNISVKDQMFQLSDSVHVLKAGEINLSSERSRVQIRNALLYPLINSKKYATLPTTFQVSIPEIQISNIDFLSAYYSKELRLNTFELNSPKFEIYTRKGRTGSLNLNKFQFPLPAFIKTLQVNELRVNAAEVINYNLTGLSKSAQSNFMINLTLPNVSLKNNSVKQAHIRSNNLIANIYDFRTPLGKTHELKLSRLDFDRTKQDIRIQQLEVNPFTSNKNDNRFSISIPRILLSNFNLQNALKNSDFEFDEIKIINPSIAIEINDSIKGDKLEFASNLDLYPFVKPYVNKIEVGRVQFQNTELNFNWFDKELINKQFNLDFKEIVIGANSKGNNLLNSKEFELSTSDIISKSKNGFYEYSADSLIYNSAKHNTLLKNIQIIPLLSRDDFHRKIDYQTDYVSGSCEFMELENIDENRWLKSNVIEAKKIVLGASNLSIFRNKRLPFNTAQRPPWPQDLLKELKQAFIFDSVVMHPSILVYSELLDLTDQPGFIEFKKLSIRTGRLSNIPEVLAQNPYLHIEASSRLYDEGLLTVNYNFNLQKGSYAHQVMGSLAPMSLIPFNQMIENSAPISIQSGHLNRFEFDIDFGENHSNGSLYMDYDNFKIAVLDRKQKGTKKSKLASFWANNLVLRSKSPKGEIGVPATISFERDIQRSIINYWWKSLFTGAKESIGLKQKK